jgi:hypothetical protein
MLLVPRLGAKESSFIVSVSTATTTAAASFGTATTAVLAGIEK